MTNSGEKCKPNSIIGVKEAPLASIDGEIASEHRRIHCPHYPPQHDCRNVSNGSISGLGDKIVMNIGVDILCSRRTLAYGA